MHLLQFLYLFLTHFPFYLHLYQVYQVQYHNKLEFYLHFLLLHGLQKKLFVCNKILFFFTNLKDNSNASVPDPIKFEYLILVNFENSCSKLLTIATLPKNLILVFFCSILKIQKYLSMNTVSQTF